MRHTALPLLALAAALSAPAARAADVTEVHVKDNELHYVGELDGDANRRLFALYDSLGNKPTMLSIRSGGGPVQHGMELGEWVHAHKLDVKVLELCASSCANYVFTAGARKIVGNTAVIGYHGGLSSMSFSITGGEAMSQQQKDAVMAEVRKGMAPQLRREEAFFTAIGVRQDITTWGQQERFKSILDANDVGVWTYTQEGFHRFGVDGIEVIDPPWTPKSPTKKKDIVALEAP